jgi:hypothetical protein
MTGYFLKQATMFRERSVMRFWSRSLSILPKKADKTIDEAATIAIRAPTKREIVVSPLDAEATEQDRTVQPQD